jgi:hypothetical protein
MRDQAVLCAQVVPGRSAALGRRRDRSLDRIEIRVEYRGDVEDHPPLVDGPERIRQRARQRGPGPGRGLGRPTEVREVVLVQNHPVVLEPEAPRQLPHLRVQRNRFPADVTRRQLLVEEIHVLGIPGVETQVLRDLLVRDALEPVQVIEGLRSIRRRSSLNHR